MQTMIIAEIGSVHDGSFGNALKLIEAVAESGTDCVKFQTHIAEAESLPDAPSPGYFSEESRMEYFKRTAFNLEQWQKLKDKADECGIHFLSSPFSLEAVAMLEKVNIFAYKIPSGEVTNLPMLEKIADIGKPVFLSSGMSNWKELDAAVEVFKGKCELTVMQCSSAYTCRPEKVGLNIIGEMKKRYDCAVGFSDHTLGIAASVAAAVLGATAIEKHFTFSNRMYGSDAKHSVEPSDFAAFSQAVKDVWKMLENPVDKDDVSPYRDMKHIFQKSIVAAADLPAGTVLEMIHLAFKKPGDGIEANEYRNLLGKELVRSVSYDEKLKMEDLK